MSDASTLTVVVEIPKGCRNKYEFDRAIGVIRLDRTLFTATQYPADYGFVRDTLGTDGDPLDALVLLDEPTFPGCWITVRPIGVFWMSDEAGVDPKLLCVPAADPRWAEVHDITDVTSFVLREIEHFFAVYKQLEPGKATQCRGWEGAAAAQAVVAEALARARSVPAGTNGGEGVTATV